MDGGFGATADRLDELLEKRSTPGIDPAKIDKRVWKIFGETTHVLVVALAGQARRIAAFDVVHELQLQMELRQHFLNAVQASDGKATSSQMGPHVATFAEASDAVDAALSVTGACAEHNAKRGAEDALPACVGVGHGRLLRTHHQVLGRELVAAVALATDASEAGQVLATQSFVDQLEPDARERLRLVDLGRAVPGSPDNFRLSPNTQPGSQAPGRLQ